MASIPNSEPATAAAHYPNSDEEIEEEEGDYDNPPPIHECFLVKLNRTLHEKMGVIKEFLTILILVLILIGSYIIISARMKGNCPIHFFKNLYTNW